MYIGVHSDHRSSVQKYKGSGKLWLKHINKHGDNITTEILYTHNSESACYEAEQYYITLAGAITFNDRLFKNILPGGKGPGKHMTRESKKLLLGNDYKDPRKGQTWYEIYGKDVANKMKDKIRHRNRTAPPRKSTGKDRKSETIRNLIDKYGIDNYSSELIAFNVRICYPDGKTETKYFETAEDFLLHTALNISKFRQLKCNKHTKIFTVFGDTKHCYPKFTEFYLL